MTIDQLREQFHRRLCRDIIREKAGVKFVNYPNFADGSSKTSVDISLELLKQIGCSAQSGEIVGQTAYSAQFGQTGGLAFEGITRQFVQDSFQLFSHLRPGSWTYETGSSISEFEEYQHVAELKILLNENVSVAAAIGGDYLITPDVVVVRKPVSDSDVNQPKTVLKAGSKLARYTPLRASNNPAPTLHASISCKWTLRSDRAQNVRTECLNLMRNRKGKLPCAVAITAEPMPTRIAALALGTGDIDCVYHVALPELEIAVEKVADGGQLDMLRIMVDGRRLRDVSDLPFDLAI